MPRRPIVLLTAFIAAVAGALGGLLPGRSPTVGATTEAVTLHINLGPEHYSEHVTCLWHTACLSPPNPGNALDWYNSHTPNEPVIWRSYGYRSIGTGIIVTGTIQVSDGTCSQVRVHLMDPFAFDKGYSYYTHTRTYIPGWTVSASASPAWSYSSSSVGFSWEDELNNCKLYGLWTGQHLHQYADSSRFSANTSYFTSLSTYYNVDSYYAWQYSQSWQWNY